MLVSQSLSRLNHHLVQCWSVILSRSQPDHHSDQCWSVSQSVGQSLGQVKHRSDQTFSPSEDLLVSFSFPNQVSHFIYALLQ